MIPIDTIIQGDCLDVMKGIEDNGVDLVLTDPPYPDYHTELFNYQDGLLNTLRQLNCRQLIFWSAKSEFPLDYSAIHIWNKQVGCGSEYERIFERNGQFNYKVYSSHFINSPVAALMCNDVFSGHKSQKPLKLMIELIKAYSKEGDLILDPFLGSGTTAVACIKTNRHYIGIELSQEYCNIAQQRVDVENAQLKLDFSLAGG
jgi:predicted methyltransferase